MSDDRSTATPAGGGVQPAGGSTASARRPGWRRPAVIVSAVLALVLLAAGIALAVQRNAEGARDQAIRDTATGYLQAVADAVSRAALDRLATQPLSKDLLTDDVLRFSRDAGAITDIAIAGVVPRDASATVAVTYRLGGQDVSADLELVGGLTSWKVADGLSDLTVTNIVGVRVNGASVGQPVNPVFPGTYTATPSIEQVALDGTPTVTLPAATTPPATIDVTPRLSDAGLQQARDAARAALDACIASKVSAPPGCPWQIDETGVQIAPDSVTYTLKNDPWAGYAPTLDLATMSAKGVVHYTVDAAATITTADRSGEVTATLDRDTLVAVDLTTTPLAVTWS